jgi:hypothetical protein
MYLIMMQVVLDRKDMNPEVYAKVETVFHIIAGLLCYWEERGTSEC